MAPHRWQSAIALLHFAQRGQLGLERGQLLRSPHNLCVAHVVRGTECGEVARSNRVGTLAVGGDRTQLRRLCLARGEQPAVGVA